MATYWQDVERSKEDDFYKLILDMKTFLYSGLSFP